MSVSNVNQNVSPLVSANSLSQQQPFQRAQAKSFQDFLIVDAQSPRPPVERPIPLPRPLPTPRPPIVKVPDEPRPEEPPIERAAAAVAPADCPAVDAANALPPRLLFMLLSLP